MVLVLPIHKHPISLMSSVFQQPLWTNTEKIRLQPIIVLTETEKGGFGFRMRDKVITPSLSTVLYVGYQWYGSCTYDASFSSFEGVATAYYIHTYSTSNIDGIEFGLDGKTAGVQFDISEEELSMTAYSSDTPMNQYGNSKYGLTLLLLRKKEELPLLFFLILQNDADQPAAALVDNALKRLRKLCARIVRHMRKLIVKSLVHQLI